jgi:hypothetical protein
MTKTSDGNRVFFSRGAIISWGKSIGLTPQDALAFMQSEGVIIVDNEPATGRCHERNI